MKKDSISIDILLHYNLTSLSRYVDIEQLKDLKMSFDENKEDSGNHQFILNEEIEGFIDFLFSYIETKLDEAMILTLLLKDLKKELSFSLTKEDKENIILDYAQRFNPSRRELYKDTLALDRWFDGDALSERIGSEISANQRCIIVSLERIGSSIELLKNHGIYNKLLWDSLDLNRRFLKLVRYRDEPFLSHKLFKVIVKIAYCFEIDLDNQLMDEKLFKFIYRIALSKSENVWIQNEAIEFLAFTEIASFIKIVEVRASLYEDPDTIFVRHHIAILAFKYIDKSNLIFLLIRDIILKDPSPYVRQAIAKSLPLLDHPKLQYLKEQFILHDTDKSVRALSITQALKEGQHKKEFHMLLWRSLVIEKDPFVLKTALFCLGKLYEESRQKDIRSYLNIKAVKANFTALLSREDIPISIKRYSMMIQELIWVTDTQNRYKRYEALLLFVESIEVGKGKKFPKIFYKNKEDELYRILSVIAQNDFSLELKETLFGAYILYRSERFGRRMWRILYEFSHPSPDKREAFLHTIARIFEGTHHFPSSILAEQAPTKVPGEPYYIPEEDSWRPYLPLPDHFLSSLTQSTLRIKPYKIYSSDGRTTISPPKFFLSRIYTKVKLSWDYANIANLRNWRENSTQAPNAYIVAMKKLGFKIDFKPYMKEDSSTTKFFSMGLPVVLISPQRQDELYNYFISAYQNTLSDLVFFLIAIFSLFFLRHIIVSRKVVLARKRIPLSVGGWGTRGKSGTERLKAALFNSLGLKVFSKTSGNEAMFLHSDSFSRMREIFLFRPYDKATIWEQADTVLLADKLNVDVYLWESMGLTPSYVEILQKRWMKDDIATITNTYPDHEDLQGPAGINIPQVMTNFIPENSTLISSEEVMYPILGAYAKTVNTKSISVGWLKAGLIAPDILSRFPYEEHTYNIALVLGMAYELDINEDEALKAMADNIVPDLGVLKAYPSAKVGKSRLLFINGMSANERFGALGNWDRMGLGKISDEDKPHIFISTVINNRADRVSRSRVFASLVVEDIVADCHVLIGSNLEGFNSYLEESWSEYQFKISLSPEGKESVYDGLKNYAKHFRIIRSKQQLKEKLSIMLDAYDINEDKKIDILSNYEDLEMLQSMLIDKTELLVFYTKYALEYEEYSAIVKKSLEAYESEELTVLFRKLLWKWLKNRIVVVNNYHATGNQVIQAISKATPPGMENNIIGIQNIKGTGLDFAYRWVAWNDCYTMCQAIMGKESEVVRKGIDALAEFDEHGPLSFELTQKSIDIAKSANATQNEYYQSQIQLIEKKLNTAKLENLKLSSDQPVSVSLSEKILYHILIIIESFMDAGDAVKRRKKANDIYKDLTNHRISHQRAAIELQKITKRQKGGWLIQKFKKRFGVGYNL
ncbi:MAG: hypothetical protein Q9M39_07945 [Sulfurovum sp.]|nr:hypothetical protein [Sulfurovum sp.]